MRSRLCRKDPARNVSTPMVNGPAGRAVADDREVDDDRVRGVVAERADRGEERRHDAPPHGERLLAS